MKKILIMALFSMSIAGKANADMGITTSKYFEPAVLCGIGAAIGYQISNPGEEFMMSATICATSALVGYGINSYYDNKFGSAYKKEAEALKKKLDDFIEKDAQMAKEGLRTRYGIIRHERVESQDLGNGKVTSPYFIETHSAPGDDADFVGD